MNLILLSGGSGKRLWPLSSDAVPKQFLKILDNNGIKESMLERICRQIRCSNLDVNITITTGEAHKEMIIPHVGEGNIVCEPDRRDTFPAISLAAAYLFFEKKIGRDSPVVVMPIDPYVSNDYFDVLAKMERTVMDGGGLILMGIKPGYPSSSYGYINLDNSFREKPSIREAEKLIEEGALWNGGVFAFRIGYILDKIKKYFDFSSFNDVLQNYSLLPARSFDYEIVENEKDISVVLYSGVWKDIGSWSVISEVVDDCSKAKIVKAGCDGVFVFNDTNIPVITLGLEDTVVIISDNGILISDKTKASELKNYIRELGNI